MPTLKAHSVAITTCDHRAELLSLLSRSVLKCEFKTNEDILQIPFPYSYTDEGVSEEVVGHAVNKIVTNLKTTDHLIVLDVPSLLNVVRILKEEMFSLGIQDEIVEGRVICLTYDENNIDNAKPAFTQDIEEGIRIVEECVDKRDVVYITLKDPEGGSGYLIDFIFNIHEKNLQDKKEADHETNTSEWGLTFPNLSMNNFQMLRPEIIIPSFDDVIEIDIKDVWDSLSGLFRMGKIVYVDKRVLEEKPQLVMLLEKFRQRLVFI